MKKFFKTLIDGFFAKVIHVDDSSSKKTIEIQAPYMKIESAMIQAKKVLRADKYNIGRYLCQTIGGDYFLVERSSSCVYVEYLTEARYNNLKNLFNNSVLFKLIQ